MVNKAMQVKDNMFTAMMLQLHAQTAQQALMQRELQEANSKLARATRNLVQKDEIIDMLKQDLEHAIDQMSKIRSKQPPSTTNPNTVWMHQPLPGIARAVLTEQCQK